MADAPDADPEPKDKRTKEWREWRARQGSGESGSSVSWQEFLFHAMTHLSGDAIRTLRALETGEDATIKSIRSLYRCFKRGEAAYGDEWENDPEEVARRQSAAEEAERRERAKKAADEAKRHRSEEEARKRGAALPAAPVA